MKTCNESFGKVEQTRYLRTTLPNENCIHKKIKSRLKSGNADCHSMQNILSSSYPKKGKIKIYRSLILPVVLYGFETWSVTVSEECRLSVFKNRMLSRILGPKRDEVTGERRRLHNHQLYDLYSSPNIIQVIKSRRMKWVGHVVHMGERRGADKVLVGKPEGKRPRGRPRPRWEEILKWFYKKLDGETWTGLIWLRVGTGGGLL
jgi:hypothetical protein